MARYEELNRRLEKHQASISTGGQHLGTYGTSKRGQLWGTDELRWVQMSGNVGIRRGGYKRLQTSSTRDVRECQGANSHMFEHFWWLLQKSCDPEYVQTLFSTSIQGGFTWHMFLPASFPSLYLSQRSWNRWTHLDEARNFSSLQGFWALRFAVFWKRHQNYWLCLFYLGCPNV